MTTATATRQVTGPRVLRPQQITALLAVPDRRTHQGRRDAALLAVMVLGGLRVGEAVRLTHENLDWEGATGRLTFKSEKSSVLRTVSLPRVGGRLLREWLDDPRSGRWWLFPGRRGEHLSCRAARDMVYARSRAAGLPTWMHPHSLRHTFATSVMRRTGNLFLVQKLLGHTNPGSTARFYLAFSVEDADHAASVLDTMLPRGIRRRQAAVAV